MTGKSFFCQTPRKPPFINVPFPAIRRACIGSLAKRADSSGKTALFLNPTAANVEVHSREDHHFRRRLFADRRSQASPSAPAQRKQGNPRNSIFALKAPYGDVINPVFLQCVEVQPGLGITKRCIFDPADRLRLTFRAAGKTYRAVCFFCGRAEQHRRVAERAVRCHATGACPHTRV